MNQKRCYYWISKMSKQLAQLTHKPALTRNDRFLINIYILILNQIQHCISLENQGKIPNADLYMFKKIKNDEKLASFFVNHQLITR